MTKRYYIDQLTPIGSIRLVASEQALHGAWFRGSRHFLANVNQDHLQCQYTSILKYASAWLDAYFLGDLHTLSQLHIPLKPMGTDFQQCVWQQVATISFGQTCSYKTIASLVARKLNRSSMSSQAVGGAIGKNPISLFIPCHRIIASNGNLTGYAGGLERKAYLLDWELSLLTN